MKFNSYSKFGAFFYLCHTIFEVMEINQLPPKLLSEIGNEPIDFITYTKKMQTTDDSINGITLSTIWLLASIILFYVFTSTHRSVDSISNETEIGFSDILFIFMGSVFLILGVLFFIFSIINIFVEGGYFVGTPTRMIRYKKGKIMSYNWVEFTGGIHIDSKQKSLIFILRTGDTFRGEKGNSYEPHSVAMVSIENLLQVEQIARKRILEAHQNQLNH